MRILSIILILTILCSCSTPEITKETPPSHNLAKDSLIDLEFIPNEASSLSAFLNQDRFKNEVFDINESKNEIFDTGEVPSGPRYRCKSKNYDITVKYYNNGNIFFQHVEDINKRITEIREFYNNGQPKEEGTMAIGLGYSYIDIWKYYSVTGKLDSIVDYNKQYKISYFKAVEIAKSKNLTLPDVEIYLATENNKTVWRILKWTLSSNHHEMTAQGIDINTETGEISQSPKHFAIF